MFETARLTAQVQSGVANAQASLAKTYHAVRDGYGFRESERWLEFKQAYYALVATSPQHASWDQKRLVALAKFTAWDDSKGSKVTARERRGWRRDAIRAFLQTTSIQMADPATLAAIEIKRQASLRRLFHGRRFAVHGASVIGLAGGAAARGHAISVANEDLEKARRKLLEQESAEDQAIALATELGAGALGGKIAGGIRGGKTFSRGFNLFRRGSADAHGETVGYGLQQGAEPARGLLGRGLDKARAAAPPATVDLPSDYFLKQVRRIAVAVTDDEETIADMMAVFGRFDFVGSANSVVNTLSSITKTAGDKALECVPVIGCLLKIKDFCEKSGAVWTELRSQRTVRKNLTRDYYRPGQVRKAIETLEVIIARSVAKKGSAAVRAGVGAALAITEQALTAGVSTVGAAIATIADSIVAALEYLAEIAIGIYDCVTANRALARWESRIGTSQASIEESANHDDVLGNPALAAVLLTELNTEAIVNVAFDLMAVPNFTEIVNTVVPKGEHVRTVARAYVESLPMELLPDFAGWGDNSTVNATVNGPPTPPAPAPAPPGPTPAPDPGDPGNLGDPGPPAPDTTALEQAQIALFERLAEEAAIKDREDARRHAIAALCDHLKQDVTRAVRDYEQTLGRAADQSGPVRSGFQLTMGPRMFARVSEESSAAVNYFTSADFSNDLQQCREQGDVRPLYDLVFGMVGFECPPFEPRPRFTLRSLRPLNRGSTLAGKLATVFSSDKINDYLERA